jgi:uncharacterized repeat protein (TIGR01451 family)
MKYHTPSFSQVPFAFGALLLCTLPLKAIDIQVVGVISSTCGGPDGSIAVELVGGIPPFTITLSDSGGGVLEEYSSSLTYHAWGDLFAGAYTVSVVDANMEMASAGPIGVDISSGGVLYLQSIATCPGEPPIALVNMIQNGMVDIWGPDVIDMSQQLDECGEFTYRALIFLDFGSYPLQYEDINGCILDAWVDLYGPETLPAMQVMGVTGSCTSGASGSITVAYGGMGPFPRMLSRLKNSAGEVVAGGCSQSAIALTTIVQHTFTGLAPGTYWVHASGQTFNFDFTDWYDYQCRDSIEVVVPALPGDCGVVNGRVFVDNNANCMTNPGESNVPATVVRLEPGPYFGNTNSSGEYSVQVPYGTYDVFAEHPVLVQGCPVVQVVQQAVHNNVHVPMEVGAPLDMQVSMGDGVARPGFEYQVAVHVSNMTAAPAGTVTLVVEHDAVLSLISATPAPNSTAGNTLTWSGGAFSFNNAFQTRTVQLRFQVPPDVGLLGTELLTTATVTTTNADADPSNNTDLLERTITGAYDPNDKLAYTSSGNTEVWQLNEDEWIDYTIRFQNTGTDTAFNVVITDTLPANLDPGSIIMGASSHTFTWELRDAGTLKFYFPNILLPDSNINEPLSHGFVGFRIRPRLPLLPGDEIENIANIYFDFNPPVITEPSVLVATTGTGVSEVLHMDLSIQPNPTDGLLIVRMTGDDLLPGMLRVRSMDGRMVMEQRMTSPEGRMDVQGLANGGYVLELLNDNGPRSVARFVKQ